MAERILKLVSILLAAVTVMLCGCAKRSAPDAAVTLNFQADFTADYRGMRLGGSVTNTRQGLYTLQFTTPPTLEGLHIRSEDGVISLRRDEALATADEPYLPSDSFPSLLQALLCAAARGETTEENKNELAVRLPCGEATLTVDDRRLPKSAAVPGSDCVITFLRAEPLE